MIDEVYLVFECPLECFGSTDTVRTLSIPSLRESSEGFLYKSSMRVFVRPLVVTDVEQVVTIVGTTMNDDEGAQARQTLSFHFACKARGIDDGRAYFALDVDDRVLGITGLHHYEWGPPDIVWLAWFAVSPAEHGHGLGSIMMRFTSETALRSGFRKLLVETYTTPEFDKARRFYAANGFRMVGSIEDYLPNGASMVVFGKDL